MITVVSKYELQIRYNPEAHPNRSHIWGPILSGTSYETIKQKADQYTGFGGDTIDIRVLTTKTYIETSLERTVDGQETRRAQEDPRVNDNDFF